ncbi:MAG: cobalamin-binding protein [Clostridiales bacterium]|jgi:5-methyltetrahydrofolate--homocysteine methyltransferase|nr:cobalamin-binding protein [Clostridiales bacterium]
MSVLLQINEMLQKGRAKNVEELVNQAINEGIPAQSILNDGLISAMMVVGQKFKENKIYVPEVLIAARAMNAAVAVLQPELVKQGVKPVGKAIVCTVKGDLHDIGKNLVKMMLEGVGIECVDLGVDVDGDAIVEAVKETGANVVCLSALLTTTMTAQKDVIDALKEAGVRNSVKVMVGGAPVTQSFADSIGADAYAVDAASAAEIALTFFK